MICPLDRLRMTARFIKRSSGHVWRALLGSQHTEERRPTQMWAGYNPDEITGERKRKCAHLERLQTSQAGVPFAAFGCLPPGLWFLHLSNAGCLSWSFQAISLGLVLPASPFLTCCLRLPRPSSPESSDSQREEGCCMRSRL